MCGCETVHVKSGLYSFNCSEGHYCWMYYYQIHEDYVVSIICMWFLSCTQSLLFIYIVYILFINVSIIQWCQNACRALCRVALQFVLLIYVLNMSAVIWSCNIINTSVALVNLGIMYCTCPAHSYVINIFWDTHHTEMGMIYGWAGQCVLGYIGISLLSYSVGRPDQSRNHLLFLSHLVKMYWAT